ncbi:hypothetical protein BDR07DRAFT_1472795 [Suillus spraguei]|nr:hypothetical protein BDR07DRAFT_1472795 [Suillus spraguei]
MFSTASLLTLLPVALSIMGSPVEVRNSLITLPMTRRLNSTSDTNILQYDKARVAAHRDYSTHGQRANVPIVNDDWRYTIAVGIGEPPTTYNLIVDSGSANTWVGGGITYVQTRTSWNTRQPMRARYVGSAYFSGTLWDDTVTLSEFTITRMAFGYDGILGIGPEGLSRGTLQRLPDGTIATITDYLYDRNLISEPTVSMFFQPTSPDTNDGALTFGEPDPTLYVGNIEYTDITTISRASTHWGLDQSITYGTTEILGRNAGIVDCGATLLHIATDAYERYRAATGANVSRANGLLHINAIQYNALSPLNFHINDNIYSLTPNAQIWPRSLNYKIRGTDDEIFLVVCDIGTRSGGGYDFVNGYVFLQRFYTVLDTGRNRIGFAKTRFTDATTN